jgi:hypothetical protein
MGRSLFDGLYCSPEMASAALVRVPWEVQFAITDAQCETLGFLPSYTTESCPEEDAVRITEAFHACERGRRPVMRGNLVPRTRIPSSILKGDLTCRSVEHVATKATAFAPHVISRHLQQLPRNCDYASRDNLERLWRATAVVLGTV